jgi:transcriptional regulator with XRE-family HTH domain
VALAKRIGSSQSRVAKMESGDPSVSVDMMLRALLAIGASREDLARLIAAPQAKKKTARSKNADTKTSVASEWQGRLTARAGRRSRR